MATLPPPSQQDVHDGYQALFDLMDDVYWEASTIEDKDRIRGIEDALSEILTQLNADDIKSRDADYQSCLALVNATNNRLALLKSQIDTIIHGVKLATQVAGAIDQALALAAKYFV